LIPVLLRARRRGGAVVDQEHELHDVLLVGVERLIDERETRRWTPARNIGSAPDP
jgi:hypothetical protein